MNVRKFLIYLAMPALILESMPAFAASDMMPYIGARPNGNCENYETAYFNAAETEPIEVEFDYDCKTAFVKPPRLSYHLNDEMMFVYTRSCSAYNRNELNRQINDTKIDELTMQLEGLGSEEQLRRLNGLKSLQRDLKKSRERILEDLKSSGAIGNIFVSFRAWDIAVKKFEEKNPLRNFEIVKQPISFGHLNFATTLVVEANGTQPAGEVEDFFGLSENYLETAIDNLIINSIMTTAPEATDAFTQYLSNKYVLSTKSNQNTRLFGRSANIRLSLTGYGACLLDRNGDEKLNESDYEMSGTKQLGAFLTLGYNYYAPYRSGMVVTAEITKPSLVIAALESYRKTSPVLANVSALRPILKEAIAKSISVRVFDAASGIEQQGDNTAKLIEATTQDTVDMLLARVTSDAATDVARAEFTDSGYRSVRYCKFKGPFGGCWDHGTRQVKYWYQRTDYNSVINQVNTLLAEEGKEEKIIFSKTTFYDTIGSKFFQAKEEL